MPAAARTSKAKTRRVDVTGAGAAPLPLLQSSSLGYNAPRSTLEFDDDFDEAEFTRQTSAALLMLDVVVAQFDPQTGVAPVRAMSEPLVEALALDATLRTYPVGFAQPVAVTANDPAPMRFLMRDDEDELVTARAYTGVLLPTDQCVWWSETCQSAVPTDIAFSSSNPRVARFVAARRRSDSRGRPEILLDDSGHVVDDPRGVFCPLAVGATDVGVTLSLIHI